MAIPISNTRFTIHRAPLDPDADGFDPNPPAPRRIADKVRGLLPSPTASSRLVGGDRVVYSATATLDPCDLQVADTLTDDSGNKWTVLWVTNVKAFGFSNINAGLRMVEGASA